MEALNIREIDRNNLSENEIIERIHAGEKELYEILVRRNNQKLFRVIRSYLSDESEIEDIMQNAYLKAFEKLHQFKQNSSFSTWLIRIGINETLARLNEKAKIFRLNDVSQGKNNPIYQKLFVNKMNPENKIIQNEAKSLLEKSIDLLEMKYRNVYLLKEVEEMSVKEVSECLNISISNVKVRLHRAKAMLKERIYNETFTKVLFEFGSSRCDRLTESVMHAIL